MLTLAKVTGWAVADRTTGVIDSAVPTDCPSAARTRSSSLRFSPGTKRPIVITTMSKPHQLSSGPACFANTRHGSGKSTQSTSA